ncbi:MAG: NADH-dependent [FeFe] hydrogenase, group A6 [Kiritimatiellae bacterium]|jgi:iron-only hydrogenase group A|nr:NADH-dependent [FeFe] hydrogenase, group A6 [Kiritimatiellia bacterium]
MEMINLFINGIEVSVEPGTTIVEAARKVSVDIPTLCYHPDIEAWAACGICIVKQEGSPKMLRACATEVTQGMRIITHDPEIIKVRRTVIELILSTHPNECLTCPRSGNCELQAMAAELGIREINFQRRVKRLEKDESTPSIVLDPTKCIQCGRCAKVCQEMQGAWALEFLGRGDDTRIAPAADVDLIDSPCIKCGQCSAHCPVGAIYEKDDIKPVWDMIEDSELHVTVQIAPATRVAIGEAFGFEPGTISTGKMYAALRRLGFDAVFDTNFSADLTIIEEGNEFVKRFTKGGTLPLITSCCPSWTDYMEKNANDFIDNFSTAKSPMMMLGAMSKTYYPQQMKLDPKKVKNVAIMPCTSKKYEITRDDNMFSTDQQDVDAVLTTRELARMINAAGINFATLEDEKCDSILGEYTGAGTIFGVTGGVMEAALRSAYFLITKEDLEDVNFTEVRGLEGIKEAEIDIKGIKVRVAVAHMTSCIEKVLNRIRAARDAGQEPPWHFIEVMACRGGCIGGGGQPVLACDDVRKKRTAGIYTDDEKSVRRCSHNNPEIAKIYEDFLGEPLGHNAHKYLHTTYQKRVAYTLND